MQNRREFLRTVGAAACGALGTGMASGLAASGSPRRPNVVLVITDDQGYGDLGCHGNTTIRTPNLDKLYAESVRLTDFHVGPTCAPTRAALMTGRYCNRTGVWHTVMGRSLLRRDETTMADVLAAGGYRTAIFGKWHLGDNYPFRPQDRGFRKVLVHGGGGVGQTPDYWGNDYFDDTYWHDGTPRKYSGYCTDVWFDGAIRFIEDNRDRPFFVYLTTNAPHGPYNVSERYSGPYANAENVPNANFYGMITNIDENMGRLLGRLRTLGLEDNTILIFMTDNGTAAGLQKGKGFNAGMRGTKGSEYDGGHRVPCFIRWPAGGVGGGKDMSRLTAHVDLLPTLIEACRLSNPDGLKLDGTSIVPLLKGDVGAWPDRVLVTDSQRIEHPEKWRKSAVMTDRWRLVNGEELYDIHADPGQRENVASRHPAVVRRLRDAYEKWWTGVSERFDEYCHIVVGSDREKLSRLTCHDWHGGDLPPWNQTHILRGVPSNGFWAVDVARAGEYELALCRWPREAGTAIDAAVPGGRAIQASRARLKIGRIDETRDIPPGAKEVNFRVRLEAGQTLLQTWLTSPDGVSRGAYYVYVRRV